jgi:S1-C subfamily serine protease
VAEGLGLDDDQRGVLVGNVVEDSPADQAGIIGGEEQVTLDNGQMIAAGGDIIVQIDDQVVNEFEDVLGYLVSSTEVGQEVLITVLRDGELVELELVLGVRP